MAEIAAGEQQVGLSRLWSVTGKTVISGVFGTALEFYDFLIYGLAAGTVFKDVFFVGASPAQALLASMATFAVGYFARPIGALIFGAIGDRVGRKAILVWTITIMGVASTLIGLLPTYTTIGLAAPAALVFLRIVQGAGAGVEMASSSVLLGETATTKNRGLIAALVGIGTNGGTLIAALVWLPVSILPREDFLSWGWRIPFLVSFIIAMAGLWMRRNVGESKAWLEKASEQRSLTIRANYANLLAHSKRAIVGCIATRWGENGISTIFLVFFIGQLRSIAPNNPGLGAFTVIVTAIIALAVVPIAGWCSDRFGRRPTFAFLSIWQFVFALPALWMIMTGNTWLVVLAFTLCYSIGVMGMYAVQGAWMVELFGSKSRLAAVSASKEIGALSAGGIAPMICAALVGSFGSLWAIGGYVMLLAFVSVCAAFYLPETNGRDLVSEQDAM